MPILVKPTIREFLLVWLTLGAQSFGGGAATLALIRREVVDHYLWMSADEFTRDWALCQIAPGINLVALTILVGRRVLGIPGIAIALFGLLFPSCLITVLITAGYARVHDLPLVKRALKGIIPATCGIGLVTAYQIASPLVVKAWKEGRVNVAFAVFVIIAAGASVALLHPAVVTVLCAAAVCGALFQWTWQRRTR